MINSGVAWWSCEYNILVVGAGSWPYLFNAIPIDHVAVVG
ncbi:hypothetical protein SAMN04487777_10185 [Priestia aryabhattai B8W22]|nr:hypothetical protein SAMN04487777_10185 [Priestia aryabhattai B8W22]